MPTLDSLELIIGSSPTLDDALELYSAVGWASYLQDPDRLRRALGGSLLVVTARHDGHLVGLSRVVGDGASIAYVQDVLVHPGYRRLGLGRRLVETVLAPYAHVHQQVLITDAEPAQIGFYQSLGFTELRDFPGDGLRGFARFPS
ncbi:MAG: GNAT family N-acetyltransferase [Propionibacteriales bacterium]|jgi:GNAT superfamily N-acetyltransferase|nr:GNAT family N-acetyltransferase [Propionibacteriales bacterium]